MWKIYTLEGCSACKNAKDLFAKHKVEYTEIDGPKNDNLRSQDLNGKNYDYYPTIFNDGKFVGGYAELIEFFGSAEPKEGTSCSREPEASKVSFGMVRGGEGGITVQEFRAILDQNNDIELIASSFLRLVPNTQNALLSRTISILESVNDPNDFSVQTSVKLKKMFFIPNFHLRFPYYNNHIKIKNVGPVIQEIVTPRPPPPKLSLPPPPMLPPPSMSLLQDFPSPPTIRPMVPLPVKKPTPKPTPQFDDDDDVPLPSATFSEKIYSSTMIRPSHTRLDDSPENTPRARVTKTISTKPQEGTLGRLRHTTKKPSSKILVLGDSPEPSPRSITSAVSRTKINSQDSDEDAPPPGINPFLRTPEPSIGSVATKLTRVTKKYGKNYQKHEEEEENSPLWIFYTTLYEEKPDSELAIRWLTEHGIFEEEAREELEEKYVELLR